MKKRIIRQVFATVFLVLASCISASGQHIITRRKPLQDNEVGNKSKTPKGQPPSKKSDTRNNSNRQLTERETIHNKQPRQQHGLY